MSQATPHTDRSRQPVGGRTRGRLAAATALSMAGAMAVVGGGLAAPAHAADVTSTTTVIFRGCDLERQGATVKTNLEIPMGVTLTMPQQTQSGIGLTVEVSDLSLPANLIDEALTSFEVKPQVWLANDVENFGWLTEDWEEYPSFNNTQSLDLLPLDADVTPLATGIYNHQITDLYIELYGLDAALTPISYLLECDTVSNPPIALSSAVYDLNATPTLATNRASVPQGGSLGVAGVNLLAEPPNGFPAQVELSLGNTDLGTYPLNEDGSFQGLALIPELFKPGKYQLRASNGVKLATTAIVVKPKPVKLKANPKKVKPGKKVKINGAKFAPGEKVKLTLKGGNGKGKKKFSAKVTAKGGTFAKGIKLKKAAKGKWKVTAKGMSSGRTAIKKFKVK